MGHAPLVFIRTRGNNKEGMGDVFGALAVSEAFVRKGIKPQFVVDGDKEALDAIKSRGYYITSVKVDEEKFWKELKEAPDAIIVYQLHNPKGYFEMLKKYSKLVVAVDDISGGGKGADISFSALYYTKDSYFGPAYMPLNDEFIRNRRAKKVNKKVREILVTLGGADTYGFTPKVVTALSKVKPDVEIVVVLGHAFKHVREMSYALERANRLFTVIRNANNMKELMEKADLAVCSGGNTLLEMAFTGTPCVVICGELFEEETAERMKKAGFGINLGFGVNTNEELIFKAVNGLMNDYKLRLRMSRKGQKLVDGAGADRISKIIIEKIRSCSND